jgi:CubicO group peptidase (beta-lactamase class C family)
VLWQKAVGAANRENGTLNTLDTQFRNGSMNKMFTATAALQLIDAGKLSLDDTVGKILPDYPNKEIASQVTIRHLLTHTGGTGDIFGPQFAANRLTLKTHADYVALYGARAPVHVPGGEFRYSNYGMVLLGAIIERVSGQSYFDFVRTSVFERAGMRSTGSLPETDAVPNRSAGYMRRGDTWVLNTDTLPWSGTSAGGGYSTVGDFFRFAEALQSGALISKASFTQMTTPNRGQYGFGMVIRGEGPRRTFGHSGGAPGQNGELRVFPESGYTVVVLSNLDPPAASRLADFIEVRLPLAGSPGAARPAVVIEDFESGSLGAWSVDKRGSGNWFAYQNGTQAPDPKQSDPFVPFHMPNPPQGKFGAVSDGYGPGTRIMYRDLKLDGPYLLEMSVFYVNGFAAFTGYSTRFVSPPTLALTAGPNQQFRVDLMSPTAAADSMAAADITATVFATAPGAPAQRLPSPVTLDLSRWAGQTVRLRIATADNLGPLRAGVDHIRLIPIAQ